MIFAGQSGRHCAEFEREIAEQGFAIFSRDKAQTPGYYPTDWDEATDGELGLGDLEEGDHVTIRAFFRVGSKKEMRVDAGLIDVEVETLDGDTIWANILTKMPDGFPLQKGTTIELSIGEIIRFAAQ